MTSRVDLPDPATAPELFDGVLKRRVFAYLIDVAIIGIIVLIVTLASAVAGFLTLGIAWLLTPLSVIIAVIGYYAVTLGSHRRATFGMQMLDLVMTPTRGYTLDGVTAFAHAFLFWISCWVFWPFILLVALFTPRRQLLHDLIVGVLILRRSPMERHWAVFEGQHRATI